MKQRPRIYYTETDKALMWDRWQKGESLNAIARHFLTWYLRVRSAKIFFNGRFVILYNLP